MKLSTQCTSTILGLCMAFAAVGAHANVQMPSIFADNLLLQRGKPIPVYGKADPAEKVAVEFAGQRIETTADAAGKWQLELAPLTKSSTPAEMRIKGKNTITLRNVLMGDLWLASGQSNMEMRVREVNNARRDA